MQSIESNELHRTSGSSLVLRYHADGTVDSDETAILHEHRMEVWLHDIPWLTFVCTPENLRELLLGRLITEGVIRGKEDVSVIDFNGSETRADVFLEAGGLHPIVGSSQRQDQSERRASLTASESHNVAASLQPIHWETAWIYQMAEVIDTKTPLYAQTHSAHSALLMLDGEILCCQEDLARHNAIDKVVGWTERKGIDRSKCILFTSGRVPVDMAMKAIRAGFPVMASKALPTQQAVPLAESYGMTLLHISERLGLLRFA